MANARADAWEEGYERGWREELLDLEKADNPYCSPGLKSEKMESDFGLTDDKCVTGSRHTQIRTVGPYWNLVVACDRCGYVMTGKARQRMLEVR